MRTLRWILTAAVAVTFVGAGTLAFACDADKASASAEKAEVKAAPASAEGASCSAKKANAANASAEGAGCSAEKAAACSASKANAAMAGANCSASKANAAMAGGAACSSKSLASSTSYCIVNYMSDLSETEQQVKVTVTETEAGVVMAFASADPAVAQAVANKATGMLTKSSACSMSRADMAKAGCFSGCEKTVQAFAGAAVELQDTDNGAVATVIPGEDVPVEQLHTAFRTMQEQTEVVKTEG